MSYDTYLYYSLSLFAGIIMKIYDDLYDNDLYETFGIKNKIFVNELLKCSTIICLVILFQKNTFFYILFIVMNIFAYLIKKDEFKEYETAGIISSLIVIPFLNYENLFHNINDLYFFILCLIFEFILEIKSGVIEDEYSLKKLIQRSFGTIALIIFLFFNFYTNYSYLSSDVNYIMIGIAGYNLMSSVFQVFLLYKNSKDTLSSSTLSTENLLIQENTLLKYFFSLPIFSYFLDLNPQV